MGKASVSNIKVSLGFLILSKALAMARLSTMATPLVILPQPPCWFYPLAPYCPFSWHLTAKPLPGWHPTTPHLLAPYCYPPAGTLLLLVVGWHPLCPVAPLAHLISKRIILRPISPRSPCAPDVPGAYNVNSSSGCIRLGLFRPEVKEPPPMRLDATGSVWMQ